MSTAHFAWRGVSALVFPVGLAGGVALATGLPSRGAPPELAVFAVFLMSLALVRIAEIVAPYDLGWRRRHGRDSIVDGTSLAIVMGVVDPLLKALWPIAVLGLWETIGKPSTDGWFGPQTPLALKVSSALLLAGLAEYALHRLAHEWLPMWRFHALHHSAPRIYWLNAFRVHPLNIAWHQLAGYGLLMFAGVDTATLTVFAGLSVVVSVFQHANARLALGFLNYVFSTNELHRWHHDSRPGQGLVNYGSVLAIWDLVFGTFQLDRSNQPGKPGVAPGALPGVDTDRYWSQVLRPFRADRSDVGGGTSRRAHARN
jgi:sterol desaturase/sphingolipid hydroxylase (fatty acid hydroxylase superfamily)